MHKECGKQRAACFFLAHNTPCILTTLVQMDQDLSDSLPDLLDSILISCRRAVVDKPQKYDAQGFTCAGAASYYHHVVQRDSNNFLRVQSVGIEPCHIPVGNLFSKSAFACKQKTIRQQLHLPLPSVCMCQIVCVPAAGLLQCTTMCCFPGVFHVSPQIAPEFLCAFSRSLLYFDIRADLQLLLTLQDASEINFAEEIAESCSTMDARGTYASLWHTGSSKSLRTC